MRANPVTTVTQPSELDQKLVWLIGPDPDDSNKRIVLITTRDGAQRKEYELPAPFRPDPKNAGDGQERKREKTPTGP
jgi:hypothetical protein